MSGDASRYFAKLMVRTFQPTVRVTDAISVMLSAGIPLSYYLRGDSIPERLPEIVGLWAASAALGVICLRLFVFAPFSIWAAENTERDALSRELAKPEFLIRKSIAKDQAKSRREIAKALAEMSIWANYSFMWQIDSGSEYADDHGAYSKVRRKALHIAETLMYYPDLRERCIAAIDACDSYTSTFRDKRSGCSKTRADMDAKLADAMRSLN